MVSLLIPVDIVSWLLILEVESQRQSVISLLVVSLLLAHDQVSYPTRCLFNTPHVFVATTKSTSDLQVFIQLCFTLQTHLSGQYLQGAQPNQLKWTLTLSNYKWNNLATITHIPTFDE